MLRLFASRIGDFQKLLAKPKSVPSSIATTFGHIEPLGFERFRICELYAELLHCSNMVLLNDPRGEPIVLERDIERERLRKEGRTKPTPKVDIWGDTDLGNGRQWGTEPLSSDESEGSDSKDEKEIPNPNGNQETAKPEDLESSSNAFVRTPNQLPNTAERSLEPDLISQQEQSIESPHDDGLSTEPGIATSRTEDQPAADAVTAPPEEIKSIKSIDEEQFQTQDPAHILSTTNAVTSRAVVGDYLKMQFVEAKVLPSVVDLFFAHPWNNFLHNVVYDILTQVLNGPMDKGFNRQLAVDLFTTGQLTEKILQGQKTSDDAQ